MSEKIETNTLRFGSVVAEFTSHHHTNEDTLKSGSHTAIRIGCGDSSDFAMALNSQEDLNALKELRDWISMIARRMGVDE